MKFFNFLFICFQILNASVSIVLNSLNIFRILAVIAKNPESLKKGKVFVELGLVISNIVIRIFELATNVFHPQLCLMVCGFKLIIGEFLTFYC